MNYETGYNDGFNDALRRTHEVRASGTRLLRKDLKDSYSTIDSLRDKVTDLLRQVYAKKCLADSSVDMLKWALKILKTLPKTADGVAIHVGKTVYQVDGDTVRGLKVYQWEYAAMLGRRDDVYSTRELAEDYVDDGRSVDV